MHATHPTLPILFAMLTALSGLVGCTGSVTSADGAVTTKVPGRSWSCAPNDTHLERFNQSAVKCKLDHDKDLIVLNAKLYRVRTEDATTAELFCVQDWKRAYATLFTSYSLVQAKVIDWRGMKACEVTLEGTANDGAPTRLWEVRAPNGLFVTTMSVGGRKETLEREIDVVTSWVDSATFNPSLASTSLGKPSADGGHGEMPVGPLGPTGAMGPLPAGHPATSVHADPAGDGVAKPPNAAAPQK